MLTPLQKLTAQAIVNVFETGSPTGDYAAITLSKSDAGCLTYGRSQTTLASGGLAQLIGQYCSTTGALHAAALSPYLPRLSARDRALDTDEKFTALLKKAGDDPTMHRIEDRFFDRAYWDPAIHAAQALAIETPLGVAVIYDSFIHGAWARLRDATLSRVGLPSEALAKEGLPSAPGRSSSCSAEQAWILAYITLRRDWLANHPNPLLRRAVYRMDTFLSLASAANWDLTLPLEAHGVAITESALSPHVLASG